MSDASTTVTVAVVQAAPVYFDAAATTDKTIDLIRQAAERGARLIAFPECWLPGYPLWAWMDSPFWAAPWRERYFDNSLELDGEHERRIAAAAAEYNMHVVLGCSERDAGSLFVTQVIYNANGDRVGVRRKLLPTGAERMVFGEGSGADLTVYPTDLGRLGALNCWEHVTLSAHVLHALGEDIHVGSWPSFSNHVVGQLSADANETHSRSYALAGGCFVLTATALTTPEVIEQLCEPRHRPLIAPGGGRSMIFAPDGKPMAGYLEPDEEGIICAELDLRVAQAAKALIDLAGHSASPDAVRLLVNDQPRGPVQFTAPWSSTGNGGRALSDGSAPAGDRAAPITLHPVGDRTAPAAGV